MKNLSRSIWIVAGALLIASPAFSQSEKSSGQGRAVVTVLPKQQNSPPMNVSQQDVSIKVNGKPTAITSWASLRGTDDKLELVILIDGGATRSMGNQFDEIRHFILDLPPGVKVAVGYMQNGRGVLDGTLTTDHALAAKAVHLSEGPSVGPYFCTTELAKHWPSSDRSARREVILLTDGIEPYEPRYDPENVYVQAAIDDAVRAHLVVYSIYWSNWGNSISESYIRDSGQNYLALLTEATGGNSYWIGNGNPVTFQPYFEDLTRRLQNQYELEFSASLGSKPSIEALKLKIGGGGTDVSSPQQVLVDR